MLGIVIRCGCFALVFALKTMKSARGEFVQNLSDDYLGLLRLHGSRIRLSSLLRFYIGGLADIPLEDRP